NRARSVACCCNSCARRRTGRAAAHRPEGSAPKEPLLSGRVAAYRAMRPRMIGESNMGKKIAGLLGAMATLGAFGAAQAAPNPSPAPTDVLRANSFAELLQPIPNAAEVLQAVDESGPAAS